MPHNTQLDSQVAQNTGTPETPGLNFPYNTIDRELSDNLRLISGSVNIASTQGGKLIKRWGTTNLASGSPFTGKRCDRLWIYENLTGTIYLIGSFFDGSVPPGTWGLYYTLPSAISWTSVGSTRSMNASVLPHEGTVSRGIFYAKAYPAGGSSDKLGTAQINTNSGSVVVSTWGLLGPTTPAHLTGINFRINQAVLTSSATSVTVLTHSAPTTPYYAYIEYEVVLVTADTGTVLTITRAQLGTLATSHGNNVPIFTKPWSNSGHLVTVSFGWVYTYAWVTSTGQISNRAPVETNPDNQPSSTGPFFNLTPTITVQGNADTTNITKINIYRTTDGGGTYFLLDTITNTGSGNINYTDTTLASGGGNLDPIPDSVLGSGTVGPTLTSNSPPTTVVAPKVIGTDQPEQSSPLETYSGRIWVGIENILFFSGQEEVTSGVPEECWPSGLNGNFLRFSHPILNLKATTYALYILTNSVVYQLTGSTLSTFSVRPVLVNIGAAFNNPRAIDRYGDAIVWLTNDYRIAVLQGRMTIYGQDNFQILSDPLYTDIINFVNSAGGATIEMDIKWWADLEKEGIFVSGYDRISPQNCRQWFYDIKKSALTKKPYWYPPWTITSSASVSGKVSSSVLNRRMIWNAYDIGTSGNLLIRLDPTGGTATDVTGTNTIVTYPANFTTNQFQVPYGDHVNELRRPGLTPPVYELRLNRTLFTNDEDPIITYFKDDLWTDPFPLPAQPENPSRRDVSKGYKSAIYPINEVCERVAFKVDFGSTLTQAELQDFEVVWEPDAGA